MRAWTIEHTKIALSLFHKAEGCTFVPWFMDGVFMYAICFTCDKKLTPDEWQRRYDERDIITGVIEAA